MSASPLCPAKAAARIKVLAQAEGFDACGIAAVEGPVDPENRLDAWLASGHHADMRWMVETRSLRRDVRERMPGAASVVVVVRNYHAPRPPRPETSELVGRVSNYAWGRDYHRVLHRPLQRIAQSIRGLGEGIDTWCSLDAGPVMEKAWAARAGIGWIGKNSLVLQRGLGSYFFLGVIVTTLEATPDEPIADGCATCTACIDACPTGAIVQPRVVDARRCISYQTIENRGAIPPEIAARHGDWLFGCDICQEVCPYNRRARETTESDFHPRPGHAFIPLDALDEQDDLAYEETYRGTPLMRAKRSGLQRNAAIVRVNSAREGGSAGTK